MAIFLCEKTAFAQTVSPHQEQEKQNT